MKKREPKEKNTYSGKYKRFIAWMLLSLLVVCLLGLNYVKFFGGSNKDDEKNSDSNSSFEENNVLLTEIVSIFNSSGYVENYSKNGIHLKATVNKNSIFISHTTNDTVVYEFLYSEPMLSITLENEHENVLKCNQALELLIHAIQMRIDKEEKLAEVINKVVFGNDKVDGINRTVTDKSVYYEIDITKRMQPIIQES